MSAKASAVQTLVDMLCERPNDAKLIVNSCRKLVPLLAGAKATRGTSAAPTLADKHDPLQVFVSYGGLSTVLALLKTWSSRFSDAAATGVHSLCSVIFTAIEGNAETVTFAVAGGLIQSTLDLVPGRNMREKADAMRGLSYNTRQCVMQLLSAVASVLPSSLLDVPGIVAFTLTSLVNSEEYEQEWAMKTLQPLLRHAIQQSEGTRQWSDDLVTVLGPRWNAISLKFICTCIVNVLEMGLPSAKPAAAEAAADLLTPGDIALALDTTVDSASRAFIVHTFIECNGASALTHAILLGNTPLQRTSVMCIAELVKQQPGVVAELLEAGALAHLSRVFESPPGPPHSPAYEAQSVCALLLWRVLDASRDSDHRV